MAGQVLIIYGKDGFVEELETLLDRQLKRRKRGPKMIK